MADNTVVSGTTVADDDIGGVKYPRVKLIHGADGVNAGDVSTANGLPVNIVTLPAVTKGTQGATGMTVQELKDAGRNVTNYYMAVPILTTNTEVMQSFAGYKSGVAVGTTATPVVVTASKTYRITSIVLTYTAVAIAGVALFTLRANLSGVGVIGSPLVGSWVVGTPSNTAGHTSTITINFPDGLEFAAATGIAMGATGLGGTMIATAVGYAHATINGFEF